MYTREDCLKIALRVMAFFARLASKPPSVEDVDALKHCAGNEAESAKSVNELARTVIDKAMVEE